MPRILDAHAYMGADPQWAQLGMRGGRLDADSFVRVLDGAGIDGALVAPPGIGIADDFKNDLDRIADGMKRHPGRIIGLCRVRPRKGTAALSSLRRSVGDRGFSGLLLHTSDDEYTLKDRSLIDPLIVAAADLKIPVIFDTEDRLWASCLPSMVADIALGFPSVTFVIARMGFGGINGWPGSPQELVPAMKKAPNTVTETGSVLLSKFIQDTIEAVGVDRVLMGSNAPYMPIELPKIMILKNLNKLNQREKELVAGGNLARLLKLPA